MSRKLSRPALVIIVLGQLVVFAVIAALALELFTRWNTAREVARNPYIRARLDGTAWPVPTLDYNPATFVRLWRSRGASEAALDPPATGETWAGRAALFRAGPGILPDAMAYGFGMKAFVLETDGTLAKAARSAPADSESMVLAEYLGVDGADWVAQQAKVLTKPNGIEIDSPDQNPNQISPGWRFLWRSPEGDLVGFQATDQAAREVPGDSLWDIPYLSYKVHAVNADGKFRTNNMRYRDDDVVIPKPEDVYRILCIGGSTTEEGNFNDVTYPNLLEERLNGQRGSHDIDVVNCGMSGATTIQHMARLSDHMLMDPDLVVIYLGVNDIVYDQYHDWLDSAPGWCKIARHSMFLSKHFDQRMLPDEAARLNDLRDGLLARLSSMVSAYRAQGVKVAVASFACPDLENLNQDELVYYRENDRQEWGGRYITFDTYVATMREYNALLKAFCAREKLPYLPVAENITGGAEYFGDVCHMKNKGIARKAEIIAEHLAPLLPPVRN